MLSKGSGISFNKHPAQMRKGVAAVVRGSIRAKDRQDVPKECLCTNPLAGDANERCGMD